MSPNLLKDHTKTCFRGISTENGNGKGGRRASRRFGLSEMRTVAVLGAGKRLSWGVDLRRDWAKALRKRA
jgi:hypothetical protein